MISAKHDGNKDGTGDKTGRKEHLRGQADDIFPFHFRTPCSCMMVYTMQILRLKITLMLK
jgi:hypothetical protein